MKRLLLLIAVVALVLTLSVPAIAQISPERVEELKASGEWYMPHDYSPGEEVLLWDGTGWSYVPPSDLRYYCNANAQSGPGHGYWFVNKSGVAEWRFCQEGE